MFDYVAFKEVFGILKAGLNIVKVYSKIKYWCCFFFSKPYTFGYYSLNGSNIKNFGVPAFTIKEEEELLCLADKDAINQWLSSFYE